MHWKRKGGGWLEGGSRCQERLVMQFEGVVKTVGGGYCRLQMPLGGVSQGKRGSGSRSRST